MDYDTVVLDIEGTITPITFVKDTLVFFFLSRSSLTGKRLDAFLDRNWGSTDLESYVELLREQAQKDVGGGEAEAVVIPKEGKPEEIKAAIKKNIEWQMAADRKNGALKAFQGFMWKDGYSTGELCGEIYADVVPLLDQWRAAGKPIYIYSSGSVPAQKLIVGYSDKGDLSKYFSGYFDTAIGLKVEAASYEKIAQEIGKDPSRILFVSDNIKEIQAAKQAKYQAVISERPGNAPLGPESKDFKIVTSFEQLSQ
ncbi:2,3-diketo-5-methylthio-1-phosphopentane phosphatase [Zychaea mexicana]|uniref:2,3-diketo-5-methylthio-1-phosphopentane phosphatase n=1 Tax=Zychaea mexicana TaxID=64656 RepID=UPI0022FF1A22|nr:2,3-diketo-5-methylthio-1-phosphopentane phosphatase [Zychaea mexicana]KAI9491049.1 2,3-diketo-5-methylthio-1-phosphopentane phosphatase [Zychaea mexicana]